MERIDTNKQSLDYEQAKARVNELKSFYNHLITYLVVIGGLAGLNYYTNELSYPWFLWAALGWGIGLGSHAFRTFYGDVVFGKQWEERKIKEYMDKKESKASNRRWE